MSVDLFTGRRPRRRLRWVLGGIAAVVVLTAIVVGPRLYDTFTLLRQGDEVDVGGGRELFVHRRGEGTPTVLLEHGLGSNGHEWRQVQRLVADRTRVCFTSRAGMGFSDDTDVDTRTAQDAVEDLRAVVDAGAIHGPFVLVGHSFGGLVVRAYTEQHPDDVVGVVLVDSMHERQLDLMRTHLEPETWAEVDSLLAQNPERMDLAESLEMVRAAGDLGERPLVVLEALDGAPETQALSDASAADLTQTMSDLWPELQADLAHLSPASSHRVVDEAGHFIHVDRPDAVALAINDVIRGAAEAALTTESSR